MRRGRGGLWRRFWRRSEIKKDAYIWRGECNKVRGVPSWLKEPTGSCVRLSLRRDMHGRPVDLMRILPASIYLEAGTIPKVPPASKPDTRRGESEAHSAASEWNRAWGVLSFHAMPQDENVVAARIRPKIARVSASIPKPVPYDLQYVQRKKKVFIF